MPARFLAFVSPSSSSLQAISGFPLSNLPVVSLFICLMTGQWIKSKTLKNYLPRYLWGHRAHRRADYFQYMFYNATDSVKRDIHLLNLATWFIRNYSMAMDDVISSQCPIDSGRWSGLDDAISDMYTLFTTFSLPVAALYYNLDLSVASRTAVARGLDALSRCLNVVQGVISQNYWDQNVWEYFQCLQLSVDQATEQRREYDATVEDLCSGEGWDIEFRHVSFAYPQHSDNSLCPDLNILEDFNFRFERGKTYGIMGCNGQGKTTLIYLLAGLYTPTKGQILINGKNMQEFNISDLRKKMSFFFQDFSRYPELSVLENILIGDISSNDVALATKVAAERGVDFISLHSVLQNLEKQPKDPGETWQSSLSGGQWQKIALARSFMRANAELFVLDEPTSALDTEAEYRLFETLCLQRKGRTTIFVSHKLSTMRSADYVLFIKHGKVVESGRPSELTELDGEFAKLDSIESNYLSLAGSTGN
jgi:ABC-type multidrug transport system fused ATPase/permease subunit